MVNGQNRPAHSVKALNIGRIGMLGYKVYQNSMDAGQRWLLINILGNPSRTWDERNHEFRYFYDDPLHRLTQSKVLGGDGAAPLDNVFDRIFYGEAEANPELKNFRGQIVKHYDTAGLIETTEYDFKGQPNSTTRKLFKNYKGVANWTDANLANDLENDGFTFTTETDALGRITKQTTPDGSVITPAYNETALLNSETVAHADPAITTVYIKDIGYNEKGQRERIVYGNDVVTKFYYDKETFRLKRLETKRQNNDPLQDWHYTFDPVGNITHIEDKNIPAVFFDNQKITGDSTYTYDALYRLREATGRESDAASTFDSKANWNDAPFMHRLNPGDPMSMRNYTQSYQYDDVGNILQMKHQSCCNNWTREYNYQAANNTLISTQVGANTYTYTHHPQHGYMTAMPHLKDMGWNFKEELIRTIRQKRIDGGTPETTYYQYDRQGQRVRKITENQAFAGNTPTKKEERIYLAGYELYRKYCCADIGLERVSLSLMDEGHRFVMIETRNDVNDGTEKLLIRYQLHNHLGSAALELDHTAQVISYEEYYPYGATAYQARNSAIKSAAKRYRYTGMERDEESGLEYHSARYYVPWLGRWLSCDPLFKENKVANQTSKADKEDGEYRDTGRNISDDSYNPDGNKRSYQHQNENCDSGKTDGQSHAPQEQIDPVTARGQALPDQEELSNLKDINLYAYCSLNPIIYHDPTGNVGILQAWHKAYKGGTGAEKFGLVLAFPFVWLAHVIVNLLILLLSVTVFNVFGAFGAWDFSFGAIQSTLGLGLGILAVLFGADVSPAWAMGAKVELPAYLGISSQDAFSLGPVAIGGHGFTRWSHEFGHTWQSRVLGPFYLFVIGIPSAISRSSTFYTETWADSWAPSWI